MLLIVVLRFVHILSGAIWAGSLVFLTVFLEPTARALGPAGGQLMGELMRRKLTPFMLAMALLAILAGLSLFWIDSQGFTAKNWLETRAATAYQIGAGCALLAAIIGGAVQRPATEKMGKIGPELAKAPAGAQRDAMAAEAEQLRGRIKLYGRIITLLVLVALSCMAIARYI